METTQSTASLGLEHALRILRRRWWAILLCVVVTPLAAFAISHSQTKEYTATAALLFTNQSVTQQASGVQAVNQTDPTGQRNTDLTLVQLGTRVSQRVASQLGDGLTAAQVQGAIGATLNGDSNVVNVAATWTNPKLAARIANTYATTFIALQNTNNEATVQAAINLVAGQYFLLTPKQRLGPNGVSDQNHLESLRILRAMQDNTLLAEAASVPAVPSSPKVFVDTVLGFIVGVFLGGALAILLERFDRRLREAREIEESYGLPVLGLVPRGVTIEGMRDNAVLSVEPFRMLRAHLRYFNVDRTLKVLLVTSAKPAEGKSTIASNLAATAAGMGTSTLLIEADLRKPALSQRLALAPSIGLSGVLVSVGTELEAIQEIAVAGTVNAHGGRMLSVLSAGVVPPNPTELLESQAMERLLEWARENYELVIVDTAPLSVVADTIPLVKAVDGVIIVSRLGFSTRDSAEHLRGRLESLGTPTLGVVINDARRRESSSYGYAYGYYGDKQSMDPVAGGDGPATETPEQASTEAPEDADAVVSGATATQFSAAGGTSNDRGNGVTSTEPTAFGSLGTNRPQ